MTDHLPEWSIGWRSGRHVFVLVGSNPTVVTNMEVLSLIGKVKSHSEDRRRSVEVGTRLGAGVEGEGVVAELVSKLKVPCRSSSQPTRLSGSLS